MTKIIINTCKTLKSFDDEYWMKIYNIFHQDLNFNCLPPENTPIPRLLKTYWTVLWKNKNNIGKEFLNSSNIHITPLGRIWEYIQTVACINYISEDNINNKKIISLGAGVEPCLYVFAKLGADVVASDKYDSEQYWFRDHVKYIKENNKIFSHYLNFKPDIKFMNLDLRSKDDLRNFGKYDIIYSVSSLEHIYSHFKRKKKMFNEIITHLNENGILCFTTELVVKYSKIRNYKKEFNKMLINFKKIILTPKSFLIISYKKNIKNNSIKNIIKKILSDMHNLYRFDRRYDFFSIEELKKLIKIFYKKKLYLVEKIDLKSCFEYLTKTPNYIDHFHSSISLTFSKNPRYKLNSI